MSAYEALMDLIKRSNRSSTAACALLFVVGYKRPNQSLLSSVDTARFNMVVTEVCVNVTEDSDGTPLSVESVDRSDQCSASPTESPQSLSLGPVETLKGFWNSRHLLRQAVQFLVPAMNGRKEVLIVFIPGKNVWMTILPSRASAEAKKLAYLQRNDDVMAKTYYSITQMKTKANPLGYGNKIKMLHNQFLENVSAANSVSGSKTASSFLDWVAAAERPAEQLARQKRVCSFLDKLTSVVGGDRKHAFKFFEAHIGDYFRGVQSDGAVSMMFKGKTALIFVKDGAVMAKPAAGFDVSSFTADGLWTSVGNGLFRLLK